MGGGLHPAEPHTPGIAAPCWVTTQLTLIDPSEPVNIPPARLRLHSDGIEVADRPLMYPQAAFGDTDLRSRLLGVHLRTGQLPNIKTSFLRQCMSRCAAYNTDPLLLSLIYDISHAGATCR